MKKEKKSGKRTVGLLIVLVILFFAFKNPVMEFLDIKVYEGEDVVFSVNQGEGASSVADRLQEMGIIDSSFAFSLKYKLGGSSYDGIYYGERTIKNGMSLNDIIILVTTPVSADTLTVTIPEGYSIEMIANMLSEDGICTYDEFISAVQNENYDYKFIKHIPDGNYKYKLEGFLFPDTYEFFKGVSAKEIIDTLLSTFQREYDKNFSSYDNIFEIVTKASIVEREAVLDSERAKIAGVINNRIKNDMLLQIDATVVYAKSAGLYDMTQVTYKDLEVVSPYNTYKNTGLTPGPICNPGIESVVAAANPESHSCLFYHTDEEKKDGSHIFTETFDDHVSTMN